MLAARNAAGALAELIESFASCFTAPTCRRFMLLMIGMLAGMGRRSVSRSLWVMRREMDGHPSDYHRVFSRARYSMWDLAGVLCRQVIDRLPRDATIVLAADDTVDGKTGRRVWGKCVHRDGVRSTHARHVNKWGHRWVVLSVIVQLPGMSRPWALPVLCGLYCDQKTCHRIGRRHKGVRQITRQLTAAMLHFFPHRRFVLLGDFGVIDHDTADFATRHKDRLTVVSRLRGDANLYAPPRDPARRAARSTTGYQKKGVKLPRPHTLIGRRPATRIDVRWYGQSNRSIDTLTDTGLWYDIRGGAVVPVRWACCIDPAAKHHAFFYSTDPQMTPTQIIELYAQRWNLEVTFEESRVHLAWESPRCFCRTSVLRVCPLILGLYSAVALLWHRTPGTHAPLHTPCYHKPHPTFADALAHARRILWQEHLLQHLPAGRCFNTLPKPLQRTLLTHLAAAA